jgi:putative transposase
MSRNAAIVARGRSSAIPIIGFIATGSASRRRRLVLRSVHAAVTPKDEEGLWRTFGDLHRRYTGHINARNRWTGHLWQARFGSVAMDEVHLIAAIRYIRSIRCALAWWSGPKDWPWSSVRAHLCGRDDGVVTVAPVLERVGPFAVFVDEPFDEGADFVPLRRAETTGRPVGSEGWLKRLENQLARPLAPRKRGPKPRNPVDTTQHDVFGKLKII